MPGGVLLTPSQARNQNTGNPCILTWYDPALGGINSSGGVANPHAQTASGEPYDPNKYTCAAPPNFAFGTKILIQTSTNKFGIVVRVNDRGGAIQMNGNTAHFDLTRIGNSALKGATSGTYKVVVSSVPEGPNHRGSLSQAAHDASSTLTGAFQSVSDAVGAIAKIISFIFSTQFLYIVAGIPLVLVGLFMVYKAQGGSVPKHIPVPLPV